MHPTLHNPGAAALLVVDIQDRLVNAMSEPDDMIAAATRMLRIANRLNVPVIVTEQYPRGLGPTVEAIRSAVPEEIPVVEKTSFSCLGNARAAAEVDRFRPDTVVLCGIETHVCVQQTALDALDRGFHVVVLADAVLSRRSVDHETALDLMRRRGVAVTTVEALAFAMLRDSQHQAFKDVSRIVTDRQGEAL